MQAKGWLDAGYRAFPDVKAKTVTFRKTGADGGKHD